MGATLVREQLVWVWQRGQSACNLVWRRSILLLTKGCALPRRQDRPRLSSGAVPERLSPIGEVWRSPRMPPTHQQADAGSDQDQSHHYPKARCVPRPCPTFGYRAGIWRRCPRRERQGRSRRGGVHHGWSRRWFRTGRGCRLGRGRSRASGRGLRRRCSGLDGCGGLAASRRRRRWWRGRGSGGQSRCCGHNGCELTGRRRW